MIALALLPLLLVAAAAGAQTMPLRHAVEGHVVPVGEGGIATLVVDTAFRYVGGQRFVLLGVADAEQHAFVAADAAGNIQRFYWVQFEQYLPGSQGRYDYAQDQGLTLNGREWRAQVRRYSTPPIPRPIAATCTRCSRQRACARRRRRFARGWST